MTALCWVVPVTRFCLAPFLDQLPQMCRLLYNHQKNLRWRLPVVGHNFKKKIFSFLFLLEKKKEAVSRRLIVKIEPAMNLIII